MLLIAGFFILKSMPAVSSIHTDAKTTWEYSFALSQGVVLFIGTNGVLQIFQGLFLRVPGVRQRLRIPLPRSSKPTPPSDQIQP